MGVFPFLKFYKLHQIVQSNTNWTKWLSFVYKTSGCGFESRCPHRVWKTWINVFLENAKENLGKSDFFVNMIQGKVGNVSATCLFSCQNCFLQYVFKCIIIYYFFSVNLDNDKKYFNLEFLDPKIFPQFSNRLVKDTALSYFYTCKQVSKQCPNSSDQQISKTDPKSGIKKQQTLELNIKSLTEKASAEITCELYYYIN